MTTVEQAIVKYGKSDPLKIYTYAKTFSDLAYINAQFLSGRMSESNVGPAIFEETIPLVADFKKLSEIGIITTASQPAEIEEYSKAELAQDVKEFEEMNGMNDSLFGIKREWLEFTIETKSLGLIKILFNENSYPHPYYLEYTNRYGSGRTEASEFLKMPLVVDGVDKNDMILTLQVKKDGSMTWDSTREVGAISKNRFLPSGKKYNVFGVVTTGTTNPDLIKYVREECTNVYILGYKFGKVEETIAQRLLKNLCKDCGQHIVAT